jgi:hypothetical protein
MAGQNNSVRKREREFKKRERERRKREKAAEKRARRQGLENSAAGPGADAAPLA